MPFSVRVSGADKEGATVELLDGETSVKQLRKTYGNFQTLQSLLKGWCKGKKFSSFSVPNGGFFSSAPEQVAPHLQKFLNEVIQQVGMDSFPVKYFFRLHDLKGKVVIVTGASSGIGKQNAYQLAEMGAHVILGCRSEPKTLPIVADIKAKTGNQNIEFMKVDLISLKSVSEFVDAFKAKGLPLHVLINNAGTVVDGKTDYGIDSTYGCNQVGPFLLTMGLLDLLQKQEDSRIVFVASKVARSAKGLPYDKIKQGIKLSYWSPTEAYSYSKLANVCTAKTLAKRFKEEGSSTKAYSVHPGVVATDIYRDLPATLVAVLKKFMISEEEGSLLQLYCAIDAGCAADSGSYYSYPDSGGAPAVPQIPESEDEAIQKLCWDETSKMCGLA